MQNVTDNLSAAFGDVFVDDAVVEKEVDFNGKTAKFYFAELPYADVREALKVVDGENRDIRFLVETMRGNAKGEGRIDYEAASKIKPVLVSALLSAAFEVNGVGLNVEEAAKN